MAEEEVGEPELVDFEGSDYEFDESLLEEEQGDDVSSVPHYEETSRGTGEAEPEGAAAGEAGFSLPVEESEQLQEDKCKQLPTAVREGGVESGEIELEDKGEGVEQRMATDGAKVPEAGTQLHTELEDGELNDNALQPSAGDAGALAGAIGMENGEPVLLANEDDEIEDREANGKKRRHDRFKSERQLEKEERDAERRQADDGGAAQAAKRVRTSGGRGDVHKDMLRGGAGRGGVLGQTFPVSRMGMRPPTSAHMMGMMGRSSMLPVDMAMHRPMMPGTPFRPVGGGRPMSGYDAMVQQHSSLSQNAGRGRGLVERQPPHFGRGPLPLRPPVDMNGPGPFRRQGMDMPPRDLPRGGPPVHSRGPDIGSRGLSGHISGPMGVRERTFSLSGEGLLGPGGPLGRVSPNMVMGGSGGQRATGSGMPRGDGRDRGGSTALMANFGGGTFRGGTPALAEALARATEEERRRRPMEMERGLGLEGRSTRSNDRQLTSSAQGHGEMRGEFNGDGRGGPATLQRRAEEIGRKTLTDGPSRPAQGLTRGSLVEHAQNGDARRGFGAGKPGLGVQHTDARNGFHGGRQEEHGRETALRNELMAAQMRGRLPPVRGNDGEQRHRDVGAAPSGRSEGSSRVSSGTGSHPDSHRMQPQDRPGVRSLPGGNRRVDAVGVAGQLTAMDGEKRRDRGVGQEERRSHGAGDRVGAFGGTSGPGNSNIGRGRGPEKEGHGGPGFSAVPLHGDRRAGHDGASGKAPAYSENADRHHEPRSAPDTRLPPPPPLRPGASRPRRIDLKDVASVRGPEASGGDRKIVQLSKPRSTGRTVIVTGLAPNVATSAVLGTFEKHGRVVNIKVETSHFFITYANPQEAISAKRLLHRSVLEGKQITVEYTPN